MLARSTTQNPMVGFTLDPSSSCGRWKTKADVDEAMEMSFQQTQKVFRREKKETAMKHMRGTLTPADMHLGVGLACVGSWRFCGTPSNLTSLIRLYSKDPRSLFPLCHCQDAPQLAS